MHIIKPAALLALLLSLCLCLSACSGDQNIPENAEISLPEPETAAENQFIGENVLPSQFEATLHYASEGSLSLGAMVRRITLSPNEGIVSAVLDELSASASLSGAVEAAITGIEAGSGVVTVDLSIEAGVNRSQQDYLLLCASIANTLLELESVNAVNILTSSRSDPLCGLPLGAFTEKKDNIAAVYAQTQSESDGSAPIRRNVLLYFPAENAPYLLPEVRQLDFAANDYVSAVIEALAAGPLVRSCSFSPIPANLDLLEHAPEIRVNTAGERIIDLHFDPALDSYLAFSGMDGWQLYGSLVLSLCSFVPEIDGVCITIGEETVTQCSINDRNVEFAGGVMRRQDFACTVGGGADLYFADSSSRLVRKEAALSQGASVSPLRILQRLIEAQAPEGLSSVFPEGIRSEDILGVHTDGRTAVVNLSANFYARCQNLSAAQERLLIYAMVNALSQLDGIGAAAFQVEGRQLETLAQSIYLKTPLLPDHGLIAASQ